ncbi:MAG: hypothetical protein KDE19_00980, partial [Caldilineaceae bacterium]|nr:hypothetical protein [Caldilineaceae bacterium]
MKIYAYTEISFKVGRRTISGHTHAGVEDRTWDKVDDELERGRRERFQGQAANRETRHHVGKVVAIADISHSRRVKQVVVDLMGRAIRYQAGDRCAILPENSEQLIERTLQTIRARGDEAIRLDATWQAALLERTGQPALSTITLRDLLTYGHLRPVKQSTLYHLYRQTQSLHLKALIDAPSAGATELWELLAIVGEEGYDLRTLWQAPAAGQQSPPVSSLLCQLIPPQEFRMYSISSAMTAAERAGMGASQLALTVEQLQYPRVPRLGVVVAESDTPTAVTCYGTASNFLTTTVGKPFTLKIVHPPRFHLPQDQTRPIVMFAGGTGISPFRSFLQERVQSVNSGENWLFWGLRTADDFCYQEEFERLVAGQQLQLRVAFSQQAVALDGATPFTFRVGQPQRITDAMRDPETRDRLWSLLRCVEEGGEGAYIYICGRADFA